MLRPVNGGRTAAGRAGAHVLLIVALLLGASGPAVLAMGMEVDPDTPLCASQEPEPVVGGACADGATLIEPDPSVIDPRPTGWDHVVVASDGRSLTVYFWMGVQDCNGLHSVEVVPTDSGIDLQVLTGTPAGAADMMCIELAQLYKTIVTLDEPLITGTA